MFNMCWHPTVNKSQQDVSRCVQMCRQSGRSGAGVHLAKRGHPATPIARAEDLADADLDCAQRSRREPAVAGGPGGSGRSPTRTDWPRGRCAPGGSAPGGVFRMRYRVHDARWRGRGASVPWVGVVAAAVQTAARAASHPSSRARRYSPTDPLRRAAGGARRRRSVGQAEPSSHFQQPLSAVRPSRRG